jgi:hypothetical protein
MNRQTGEFASKLARQMSALCAGRVAWPSLFFFSGAVLLSLPTGHFAEAFAVLYNGPSPDATAVFGPVLSATDQHVTESSIPDRAPLFGPPTGNGDSIDFNPADFAAGGSVDLTDGQLVQAKPNFGIDRISFREAAITNLARVGTYATHSDVSAVGNIDIYEVDRTLIGRIAVPLELVFPPLTATGNHGTFQWVADAGLGVSSMSWSGNAGDKF